MSLLVVISRLRLRRPSLEYGCIAPQYINFNCLALMFHLGS